MRKTREFVIAMTLAVCAGVVEQAAAQVSNIPTNIPPLPAANPNNQPMSPPFNPAAQGAGSFSVSGGTSSSGVLGDAVGVRGPQHGIERFLRTNRSPRDFVGRSRSDISTFIGAQQAIAAGQVRSATDSLRLDRNNARRLNQPLPPQPKRGLYYPRLELSLDNGDESDADSGSSTTAIDRPVSDELRSRIQRVAGQAVQIQLQGTTAILSGQVSSPHSAQIINQLLSFEPGIDRIDNRTTNLTSR